MQHMDYGASPQLYWKRILTEISEVARITLKNIVSQNTPPLPKCYEREFWDVATKLGKGEVLDLAKRDHELVLKKLEELINSSEGALKQATDLLREFDIEARQCISQLEQNLQKLQQALIPETQGQQNVDQDIQAIQDVGTRLLNGLALALEKMEKQEQVFESLKKELDHDALTKVYNRRSWERDIKEIVECAALDPNGPGDFCIVIVDLDHFKAINDTYGHPIGDAVLKQFATLLKDAFSHCGSVYRYGGEEFGIILPGIGQKEAFDLVERFRLRLKRTCFTADNGAIRLSITASYGICGWTSELGPEELVTMADKALYQAKKDGRDRIRLFDPVKMSALGTESVTAH